MSSGRATRAGYGITDVARLTAPSGRRSGVPAQPGWAGPRVSTVPLRGSDASLAARRERRPRCAFGRPARQLHALALWLGLALVHAAVAAPTEIIIDFETATIGKPVTSWEEQEVVFTLAHEPRESKARGRVMFFPHLATQRKGILCAMATELIPVRARFPRDASSVTLVLWGSTGCAARLEAFDATGNVVATASLPAVPGRAAPGDPVPFCELTVRAPTIAYVEFSGPRAGEFLAADEVRYTRVLP